MALDFPANPSNGQNFSAPGSPDVYWTYDGAKWVGKVLGGGGGEGGGIPEAPVNDIAHGRRNVAWTPVLMLSGDTLDGGNF